MNIQKIKKYITATLQGQSLIELLLVVGMAAIFLPALATGLIASRDGEAQQKQRLQAVSIMKETQEAVRNFREQDWETFAVNGTYHPELSSSNWILAPNAQNPGDGFTRSVVISDVYRDSSGAIVTSGGTIDLSTKRVVTTITWTQPYTSSITTTSYLKEDQVRTNHYDLLLQAESRHHQEHQQDLSH